MVVFYGSYSVNEGCRASFFVAASKDMLKESTITVKTSEEWWQVYQKLKGYFNILPVCLIS
jgi:hypothetical protein